MKTVTEFLESSSINGLNHVATSTNKWKKIFWAMVVLEGFSVSAYLIFTSFQSWSENPIRTTIETYPIREALMKEYPKNNKALQRGLGSCSAYKACVKV